MQIAIRATHQAQGDVGQVAIQKSVDRILAVAVHKIGIAARRDTSALTPAVSRRAECLLRLT
jgi:hypothetical protein